MRTIDYKVEWKLRVEKREGHMRLVLFFSPDPNDFERAQSAGGEWEDAIARGEKIWGFRDARLFGSNSLKREYTVTRPE